MKALKSKKTTKRPVRPSIKEDFDEEHARAKNIQSAKDLDAEKLMQLLERTKPLRVATEHDDD